MKAHSRRRLLVAGCALGAAAIAMAGVVAVRRAKAFAVPRDEAGRPLPVVVLTRRHVRRADAALPWSRGPSKRALKAFGAAYGGDEASRLRPGMVEQAVSRAEELGGRGESLRRALAAIEERRTPQDKQHLYDWLPCYIELVRHEGRDHWVIRVAWGDCSTSPERLHHVADYIVTAGGPATVVSELSCA